MSLSFTDFFKATTNTISQYSDWVKAINNGGVVTPDPTDPTDPTDSSTVLPVGSSEPVTATDAANVFSLDVTNAYVTADNTQISLDGFTVDGATADALRFDLPATAILPAVVNSLDDLDGVAVDATRVISVQLDPFTNSTVIGFGADGNGDSVTLTLAGIVDPATVDVTVI